MKQIFNNLRAILTRHKENMPVVVLAEMLAEIDEAEAEAKWEAECCEWKRGSENKDILFAPHEQGTAIYESCLPMYPYCQVCGKRIKISEVE